MFCIKNLLYTKFNNETLAKHYYLCCCSIANFEVIININIVTNFL